MARTSGTRRGNGTGQGDGWGGEAKGAGSGAPGFTDATRQTIPGGKGDPGKAMSRAQRKDLEAQRTADLEERLYTLAMKAEREETSVTAAAKLHAIYNGQPVSRVLTHTVDDVGLLSDDALREQLAALGGAEAGPPAGDAPAGMPKQPKNMVH